MDFNATIDLIIKDLQEAREIIDDLKKYPGVPVLQVELAKAKCKSAGEVIALLKKTEDRRPETEGEKPVPSTPIHKPQTSSPEPVTPSHKPPAPSPQPHASEINTDHHVRKPSDVGTIGDSFSHLSSRFNEQLGNRKADDDLTGMLKTKPITSLTEAIGINDRFLFIREIFDGNKDAYTQAISKLENTTSITDARAVIMSYTGDNDESEAVRQLLDLVKRKLPANE